MIKRELYSVAFDKAWGRQMRFVTGPRQAGKTTIARQKLRHESCEALYYLWDLRAVRNRYKDNELFFTSDCAFDRKDAWVCFDEIHKLPRWKNILKAVYDETSPRFNFIVTGSAKLNLVKRAGDSLAGRYFTFHLLPLTLREAVASAFEDVQPPETAMKYIAAQLGKDDAPADAFNHLLRFGGFPEPFSSGLATFRRKWADDYVDTVIREDIGSLTRILDREKIYDLYRLLPAVTGSPISESSLASHLNVSPVTVKQYLRRIEDFYLGFSVAPYSRNIKRALLKARKFYLFDWASIADDAKRFETFIACQLKARLSLWQDACGEKFDLYYVRNKQKQETDFLVLREGTPWFMLEAKLKDGPLDAHHAVNAEALGSIPVVQVCLQAGIAAQSRRNAYRVSAARFLR